MISQYLIYQLQLAVFISQKHISVASSKQQLKCCGNQKQILLSTQFDRQNQNVFIVFFSFPSDLISFFQFRLFKLLRIYKNSQQLMEKNTKQRYQATQSLKENQDFQEIKQIKLSHKVGHYLIGQLIGRGGYGQVYSAIDLSSNRRVAAKIINGKEINQKKKQYLLSQASILSEINHPKIVKCFQVLKKQEKVYIFMQFVNGYQLFQLIRDKKCLPEKQAIKIFKQVCQAIKYLHDQQIYHRDIKAQNIMICSGLQIKLIDFGLAKRGDGRMLNTFCGSPSYKSPEILSNTSYSGDKNDIWSLGVLLFVMIEGRYPFGNDTNLAYLEIKYTEEIVQHQYRNKLKFSSKQVVKIYDKIFVKQKSRICIKKLLSYILLISKRQFDDKSKGSFKNQKERPQKDLLPDLKKINLGESTFTKQPKLIQIQGFSKRKRFFTMTQRQNQKMIKYLRRFKQKSLQLQKRVQQKSREKTSSGHDMKTQAEKEYFTSNRRNQKQSGYLEQISIQPFADFRSKIYSLVKKAYIL